MKPLGKIESSAVALRELGRSGRVRFSLTHSAWYLADSGDVELHAVMERSVDGLFVVIDDSSERLDAHLEQATSIAAGEFHYPALRLDAPLLLDTVRIEKPWGAEVWYTGIEQRGVCAVEGVPLPWLTAIGGYPLLGVDAQSPLLLKILDPLPDDVYGDLYFEMHEEKIEVYVVTDVNPDAWPDGEGAIRFGFDERVLAQYDSRDDFKRAYADSVHAYREVRREIDAAFDSRRRAEGIDAGAVVRPDTLEAWKAQLEPSLTAREHELRSRMNAFTALQPLALGDVVRVPPFTPHSLQHGVRVIEFQTPHYERYILSFAQKVLTQDHWDTDEAVERINWGARFDKSLALIESGEGYRVEMAADFSAFEVHRVQLSPGAVYALPPRDTYALAITIYGQPAVAGRALSPEQAALLPAGMEAKSIAAADACCLLLAVPKKE